jgi:type II secretory pathway component PulF
MLLSSGVPCPQALEVAAVLLPARQRAAMRAVTEGARQGRPLTPLLVGIDIFPAFVLALIEVGEENGTLDVTLHQASEVFEHELACRLSAEESV